MRKTPPRFRKKYLPLAKPTFLRGNRAGWRAARFAWIAIGGITAVLGNRVSSETGPGTGRVFLLKVFDHHQVVDPVFHARDQEVAAIR